MAPFRLDCRRGLRRKRDGPSKRAVITTIQYQRVYPAGNDNGQRMLINVSLPDSKKIPFCQPVQQTTTFPFVCNDLNWEIRPGEEAAIWVNDPALDRGVATTPICKRQPDLSYRNPLERT